MTDTNQASEDELDKILHGITGSKNLLPQRGVLAHSRIEAKQAILELIRTEKLKLLDRLSSHQEDLFWWTGGEYEKTKAVDMRAVAAERDKLAKLEAEL